MPPAFTVHVWQVIATCLSCITFVFLSQAIWSKTRRILALQLLAFSPIFYTGVALIALRFPPDDVFFEPSNPSVVVNKFLVASGLSIATLAIATKVIHRPLPEAPGLEVVGLKTSAAVAGAIAVIMIAVTGLDPSVITGVGRSAVRESSPILVALLGYFFPMAALGFARWHGTLVNRWTVICLAVSLGSILLGFRGLLMTSVAAVVIAATHLGEARSVRYAKALVAVSGCGLVALTLSRPGSDGGLYQALSNRMVFTPIYQIEKAAALHETVVPGAWIWADLRSRAGLDAVTLQQAVWRIDFPHSKFIGGSYPAVGDLVGNFGWYWWCAFLLLLLSVLWWDATGVGMARSFGPLLNDLVVLIAVRVAFFGLSAAYTPIAILGGWLVLLRHSRRKRKKRSGAEKATSVLVPEIYLDLRTHDDGGSFGLPHSTGDGDPHPAGVEPAVAGNEHERQQHPAAKQSQHFFD